MVMADQITKAEFEVMEVLWGSSPIAATEVAATLAPRTGWSVRTVKTLLSRLVEKGAASHQPDGRRFLYSPALSRSAYAQNAAQRLAAQLFDGRAAPLVAHLAAGDGLSEADLQELEALVKELKRDVG